MFDSHDDTAFLIPQPTPAPTTAQPTNAPTTSQPTNAPTTAQPTPAPSPLRRSPRRNLTQPLRRSQRLQNKTQRNLLAQLVTQKKYMAFVQNHFIKKYPKLLASPVLDQTTGKNMEYRDLIAHTDPKIRNTWANSFCNELGRLAQGYKNRVQFADCIDFITYNEIPPNKRATYARIVSEIRPQKTEEPHRVRITVGGNLIYYPFDKSQPTADITTVKLHLNSTISTPGARYACLDIKNMYLMSVMKDFEYMFIEASLIPKEFLDEYNLHDKIHNGKIYIRIKRGMYGLPQAGKLAFDQLKAHVKQFTPEWAYGITTIKPEEIRKTARAMAHAAPAVIVHPGRHVW